MGRWTAWIAAVGLGLALLAGPVARTGAQEATPLAAAGARIEATYVFEDIPLAELQDRALPDHPLADDHGMLLGGIGSDLWHDPSDPADEFWMVTDRGPNDQIEVDGETRRTFPVPDFTPLILHVRAAGGALTVEQAIPLVGQSGDPITGMSNIEGVDEKPYDYAAKQELPYHPSGLDTEGLVRTAAGDFWLADEYSPSLVKVDANGTVVARYVPEGIALSGADYPVVASLPAIYADRQNNRGFEGLALSGDGRTLYSLLQSPLANPDGDTGEASRNGRILAVDAESGRPIAEYVYPFEEAATFDPGSDGDQNEMKLSSIVWLNPTTLLVNERTDAVARLYTVDLAGATGILGSQWDDPTTSPSLEAVTDLDAAGITPLPKTLLVDLEALPGMPDKIEGVTVVDDQTVAVANDNDFDIGPFDENGRLEAKGTTSELVLVRVAPIPGLAVAPAATPVATPLASPMASPVATT